MADSKLRDLFIDFSVKVIKMCETIKGHYSLVNQLERSATSIGANIYEANYAHGGPDFVSKLQIALKECYETDYWIQVFVKSEIIDRYFEYIIRYMVGFGYKTIKQNKLSHGKAYFSFYS